MKSIKSLTNKRMGDIQMVVFDVDGVLVRRGTKIKRDGEMLTMNIKTIAKEQIKQIKKLVKLGFEVNISSGRGLYMLQEMFREVLEYVSITYENGSATWSEGRIEQHCNSFDSMKGLNSKLVKIKNKDILGFEPKEHIITIHCSKRVKAIENRVSKYPELYCLWNGEAYDIGDKRVQDKGSGLMAWMEFVGVRESNVLAIGDNYNDIELLNNASIKVTADKERLKGDYYIPLDGAKLPGAVLMDRIIKVMGK